MKESNRLLSQENARLQAIVTQSQMLGYSNLHAVISLKKDNDVLKSKLEEKCFGANFIADNDSKTLFYTGLELFQLFLTLFNLLRPLFSTTITNCPLIDEFFLHWLSCVLEFHTRILHTEQVCQIMLLEIFSGAGLMS